MPHRNRLSVTRPLSARPMLTALAIATGSLSAHALTLGRLQVLSSMGEPLRAEVEVNPASAEETRGLRAEIATPRSFQQAGMEYNPALEGVSTSIDNRGERSFIVLQGRKPVQDTFVDLILETQWSTGRLVRNYALLLNSASSKPQQAAPQTAVALPAATTTSPGTATSTGQPRVEYNAQNVPVYRFDPVDTAKAAPSAATAAAGTDTPAVQTRLATPQGTTVTVAPGQTASHLALAHMPTSVSLDQMLVAMLRNNPHAFIEDNVNLVRAGAVLQMPSPEQAQQTSAQQARQIVIAQTRDFAAYARRLAESPLKIVNGPGREASGKVTAEVQAAPDAQASEDTLTLSKSQVGKNSAEVKLAAEREAREASDQTAELNKNIEDLNSLLAAASAAKESTAAPAAAATAALPEGLTGKPLWMWGAGLAALLGLLLWKRNRNNTSSSTFAPSYDDVPAASSNVSADAPSIPPEMASIDLNLPANPIPAPAAASTQPQVRQDTDAAKLELAQLLLSKGDTDIARTLVQSVAANGIGEYKARALQMLGQIR